MMPAINPHGPTVARMLHEASHDREPRIRDHLTAAGAQAQAERIKRYWRAEGYDVRVWIDELPIGSREGKAPYWFVRSDMVNGMPRRRVKRVAEQAAKTAP